MTDPELKTRLRERVRFGQPHHPVPGRGDFDLNPHLKHESKARVALRPAAVLVPIVERDQCLSVIFTRRADHLARHAGQVSFPGGRVNEGEANAIDAALRETEEEVGLSRMYVEVIGELDRYETGTGFSIQPIVGLVSDGFELKIDPSEVAEVFEVPLRFLMDRQNHEQRTGSWQGIERRYHAMNFGRHYIWGATAGILINLYETLYG
ncbi:MAG: CoA pyrophosphatase [Micropepsaceae bacterium]